MSFRALNNNTHPTRDSTILEIPLHRLAKTELSPKYAAIKLFNKLPKYVREMPLQKFKTAVKSLLLNKAYYDRNEYLNDVL